MHVEVPGFMDGLRLRRGVYLAWLALVWVATSAAAPRYTNSWAVEIKGGAEAADQLAWKHRFVNHGQARGHPHTHTHTHSTHSFDIA